MTGSRTQSDPADFGPLDETAARHLTDRIPRATAEETVSAVLSRLTSTAYDCADTVFVVDETGRLSGSLDLTTLLQASHDFRIAQLPGAKTITVREDCDQEEVADLAVRHGLLSVPVTSSNGILLGAVPPRALLEILRREHIEDVHRLAGIHHDNEAALRALEGRPGYRVLHRLPWLVAGLAGSVLATFVMARHEHVLEARIAIAFFVPGIVYLADAIGTQTEAIAVRGLALSRTPLGRLLAREVLSGVLIGAALATIGCIAILVTFRDVRLAGSVALAIIAAGGAAAGLGLLLPWLLARYGRDPAFGSGPLATVIQDVVTLLIYFAIATALLL